MKKEELTQEKLKELLHYDPDTGVFTWKERPLSMFKCERDFNRWNSAYAGKEAGDIKYEKNRNRPSWKRIRFLNCEFSALTLAYFYMAGIWPIERLDCIDGDYTNLKFKNIRECTWTDSRYKTVTPKGKNKLIGVQLRKSGKYEANITVKRKTIYLGSFNTPEEAHAAYVEAKRQISPEFNML